MASILSHFYLYRFRPTKLANLHTNYTWGLNKDEDGVGVLRHFPCEQCVKKFDDFDKFNEHFAPVHAPGQGIKCIFCECHYVAKGLMC